MGRRPGSRTAPIEVRQAALRLLKTGLSARAVGEALQRSLKTIEKWRLAYRRHGEAGIALKRIPGRPRKLTDRQLFRLVFCLAKGPSAYGFHGDVWTLPRIAKVIEKEFGVRYDPSHVRRLLIRLGFSHQRPELTASDRDEREVRRFRQRVWPQFRRRVNGAQARTLVMLDESGKSVMPVVVATWAPRGKTPRLTHLFRYVHVALIGAITPAGKLYYRLHQRRIHSDQVIGFLRHLMARIPGKIELFWDGGAIHTSKIVERFLDKSKGRLRTHFFPAYAPDVNPQELVWQHLKYVELRNVCPTSAEELAEETRAGMERIRHHPELFPAFFEHAGLSLYPP